MRGNITSEEENSVVEMKRKPPRFETRMVDEKNAESQVSGDLSKIESAAGNPNVLEGLLNQIARLGSYGKQIDDGAANFVLGFVDSMKPRDPAEALLCTQMAALHQATMQMAKRLNHVENIPQQDSAERALNKLSRSFATQMETFKRYRSKGKQTVRVERVTVTEGGQAIVGNVQSGGRGYDEK